MRWIENHSEEVIEETRKILQIPSVEEKATVGVDAPFGRPIAEALEHTLALCQRLGMDTQNFGGYAGHAQFGQGEEIIGVLGHLDVVPVGSGWTRDPWGAQREEGWLYGRGSSDDKGPTYAALFAAKAVLDTAREQGVEFSRRIRLIFGCDEESGWQCMAHYFGAAGQPKPTLAFTPDAVFPVVYAEKGSFTAVLESPVPDAGGRLRLHSLQAGLRANMVPDEAVAYLQGEASVLEELGAFLNSQERVQAEPEGEGLKVVAAGKSAHGARPFLGVNAALVLLEGLLSFPGIPTNQAEWLRALIGFGATDGSGVGIAGKDEITTPLTCNLGVLGVEDGVARATFNIRYPATWDGEQTIGTFRETTEAAGWSLAEIQHTPALYVPPDQEPVTTLLRVYREQTGDMQPPRTMGGRTYATTVAPVGVAYGAALPDEPEVAHQADERFSVERLLLCTRIYANALWALSIKE